MRFGVTLPTSGVGDDPRAVIDLAVEAESAGWDGVFIWDFPLAGPEFGDEILKVHEAWTLLGAIASRTERVLLGTMITPLAWRLPWLIAKQASTLQALTGGRFVLSVGLGAPPSDGTYFYESADRRERAKVMDEGLQILEGLWSGEPLRFTGRHFRSRNDPTMRPVVLPRPTVWIVGAWNHDPQAWPKRRSFRRALKWDGLLPHFFQGDRMVTGPFDPASVRLLADDVRRERRNPSTLSSRVVAPTTTTPRQMMSGPLQTPERHGGWKPFGNRCTATPVIPPRCVTGSAKARRSSSLRRLAGPA